MIINVSIEIGRRPNDVFPWLSDVDKAMKWQRNVKSQEIIEKAEHFTGTKFKETIEEDGNSLEMQGVITKYVLNQEISFHLESKIHQVDVTYSVQNYNDNSKIFVDATIKWNFPINLIAAIRGKKMQEELFRQMKTELNELKTLCENDIAK